MKKLTNNFSLHEFEKSATAKRLNINNNIPEIYMPNVTKLANVMQTIRDAYGKPIIITSGYRCEKLNRAVGGSRTSDHKFAAACDFQSVEDTLQTNYELWKVILRLREQNRIFWRQLIWEYGEPEKGMSWIHLSVNHNKAPIKNNQILYIY